MFSPRTLPGTFGVSGLAVEVGVCETDAVAELGLSEFVAVADEAKADCCDEGVPDPRPGEELPDVDIPEFGEVG